MGARPEARISSGPRFAERHDLVGGVVADVGTAEIGNAGQPGPMLNDLDFRLAEVGVVPRDRAAAAEPDSGDAPDRRVARDVKERAVDAVYVLRYFLEHQHVIPEIRLQGRADQLAED